MANEIDPISWLEEAIFRLKEVRDKCTVQDAWMVVLDVTDGCIRPALAELESREKRIQTARELLSTVLAIDREATEEAKRDPGVLPVLRKLDCKVAQLTAPELLASIREEVNP